MFAYIVSFRLSHKLGHELHKVKKKSSRLESGRQLGHVGPVSSKLDSLTNVNPLAALASKLTVENIT